ncbi:PH domain-containing protein [Blastococcus sp. BMG 814]|uniref:PH domain-containing protein n=1 Tax=Blastococcus carthaginiensis TaxID=3050034 RepID=A0ABT9IHI3_9ACTN|nr:PH domain-containing protein [Blastococcus carthaginiensis]MDP5185044.1 PH domain-containing protein [Blastococcus carthaginiensis]
MQWSPPVALPAGLAAGAVALGSVTLLLDPAGRILVGGAALLLLVLAVREALLRPRLTAGPDGVAVRTLTGTRVLPWGLMRVHVRSARRWGTTVRTLELEGPAAGGDDGLLLVLGRWDLGADPATVAGALAELRPRGGPAR